jgi:hypothetical protein
MREFDVGIEKENVCAVGLGCSQIATDGRHSATDDVDVQAIAKA